MSQSDKDLFSAVAQELTTRSESLDQVYEHLKGTLTVLFQSKAFEGYEFVDVDIEYEGEPREQWTLYYGTKEAMGNIVSKEVVEQFFSISAKSDGSVSLFRSDEISKIALDKIVLEDESIDRLHPEFSVEAMAPAAAAAKIISRICASDGDFSQRFEVYARENPQIIKPPQYSPYNNGVDGPA